MKRVILSSVQDVFTVNATTNHNYLNVLGYGGDVWNNSNSERHPITGVLPRVLSLHTDIRAMNLKGTYNPL